MRCEHCGNEEPFDFFMCPKCQKLNVNSPVAPTGWNEDMTEGELLEARRERYNPYANPHGKTGVCVAPPGSAPKPTRAFGGIA
jgi:hypothetical protein